MISDQDFPRLNSQNHRVTSPLTARYNCIAWSAGDTDHWWQPGLFWPLDATANDFGIEALERAFAALGFERSADDRLEEGYEKVALYQASTFYTHAARQLPDGKWTSKLGRAEDIEHHSPGDVTGGVYGEVARILKRIFNPS